MQTVKKAKGDVGIHATGGRINDQVYKSETAPSNGVGDFGQTR